MKMASNRYREEGATFIGTLIRIPLWLFIAAAVWFAYCEARKAYWDHQVKLMCENDGGVKIYEKIQLSPEEYKSLFPNPITARIPFKSHAKSSDSYVIEVLREDIHRSPPQVWKINTQLFRTKDRKLIAEKIEFGRVGGDFPTWGHDTYFSCNELDPAFKEPFLNFVFSVNN